MPTYVCSYNAVELTQQQKSEIATRITDIHHEVTGANAFFVQVIFHEIAKGNLYVSGSPPGSGQAWLHGHIRAGRNAEVKERLVLELMAAVSEVTQIKQEDVWVYVSELAPRNMAEYGALLPLPGDEKVWFEQLPADVQRRLSDH